MKVVISLASSVLLMGCGVELLTTTAIVGELQKENAVAMKGQLDRATDQMARTRVQSAVNYYYGEKGYYPATLFELAPGFINELPIQPDGTVFNYNPKTGKLLKGPGLTPPVVQTVTSGERYRMGKIRDAINEYGYATGFYPATLQDLVPTYITSVPLTDSRQQFVYHADDGSLYHPAELARASSPTTQQRNYTQRVRSSTVGAAGSGPLGETMTSIAIQNQLGNMNSSGVNQGRSTGASSLRRTQQNYNRQQEKALRDLGN